MNKTKMAGREGVRFARESEEAVREAKPWLDKLARMGYCAKGTVNVVIGLLAVLTAIGAGGEITNTKGALAAIGAQPFGTVLLLIMTAGLMGLIVWRLVQAFLDPDHQGKDGKGIFKRTASVVSALIYGSIAVQAVKLMLHTGKTGGNTEKNVSATLLQHTLGATLIGIAGAAFIVYGVIQLRKAFKGTFTKLFIKEKMGSGMYRAAVRIARFGISARGVVFGLIGYFLIQTAVKADPNQTRGLDGALVELAKQPLGRILLGAAALGFVAYGVYMYFLAKYRKTFDQKNYVNSCTRVV